MTKTLRKFLPSAASTEGLADKRQVLVNCSAEGVDRQGDIIVQSGIDTANFMKTGGTVLWQHDADTPIARCVSIGLDGGNLKAIAQFPEAGISPKADEIYGLIKAGVINATSIGFAAVEWEPMDPKEPWGGRKYTAIELMEFSFVSVPAMADATVIARAHGAKSDAVWKVGASRNLPIGGDEAWDGPAAEASIFGHAGFDGDSPDYAFARKGFLAYDSANPKLKGSYKEPFARLVDGRLTAMPSGVRAAASRLPSTDIPEDVRAKARAVLDHYEAKMSDGKSALVGELKALGVDEADPVLLLKSLIAAHKGGRVLSAENYEHIKAMQKCLAAMGDCQTKALDSHGETHEQLQAFVAHLDDAGEHLKALMKAGRPKADPDPADETDEPEGGDDDDDDVELAAQAARRKRMVEVAALA